MVARRPLIWFTVCWIVGASAAASLTNNGVYLAGAALLAAILALGLMKRASLPLAAACCIAYMAAAGERMWADSRNVTALPELQSAAYEAVPAGSVVFGAEIRGTIISPIEIDGDQVRFRAAVNEVLLGGRETNPEQLGGERVQVQVRLAEEAELVEAASWKRGQKVSAAGELSAPMAATNFGGFDYRRYLNSQRIHWLFNVDGASSVQISAGTRWSAAGLLRYVDDLRAALGAQMDNLYPDLQSGYMKGLVLGISDDLDPAVYGRFAQLGLTHILAISGLHVAVFLYLLGGLLRLTRMTRERMLLLLMAAVPLYVLLAGASPSVVRSGIMAVLGLGAARLHKLGDGLHLLAAAALLMLAFDPYMLGNVGFQLSFLVTAGLILGVPPVRGCLPAGKRRWTRSLLDLLTVTVVAQLVSLPVTIYYFNAVHLLSIGANLVLVPFISFIVMPLGGASMLLGALWHPAGALLSQVAVIGNEWTFAFVTQLSSWNSFRMIWAAPPLWWVVAYYGLLWICLELLGRITRRERLDSSLGLGLEHADSTQPIHASNQALPPAIPFIDMSSSESPRARRRSITLLSLTAAGLSLLVVWAYHPDFRDRNAYVDYIDVGQGDAILIRASGGKHILIDGGGAVQFGNQEAWRKRKDPYEVGRKLLVPLLQKRGVHRLDMLVLSHLDSDHIKGLQAVLNDIEVKAIMWNGTLKASEDAATLLRTAVDKDIPLYKSTAGLKWQVDPGTAIQVLGLAPGADEAIAEEDEQNGQSVALLVELYNRRFLFTGDADAQEEKLLLEQLHLSQSSLFTQPSSSSPSTDPHQSSPPFPPIDVMKISHHGSKTSTSDLWLNYWRPKWAVVSVGRTNSYGHPAQEVLERLASAKIRIRRTDRNGEIRFRVSPDQTIARKEKIPDA
ncbi:DNA internalization-related competence protein ComEC/Rec2 [Paenibacillus lignilyticus]|uniref:DNA internalization-related competence protein ComEC/Rec2 n=1 Tax=Paenibacillus lignilyticus TaxID=1172615 RepID=A0ABS5CK04_9BACL|nr:DNA internalization-related competence protein ComEC/Rec2 [Paenibacillus lignilyticus]MBP3966157.1 DNA internalization-related competence protein ComEC/Rec2 [Paenibacillus lignilyticus]